MTIVKGILPALAMVSLALFSACSGNSESSHEPQAVVPGSGQEIFLNYCMGCHTGSGDPPGPNGVILKSSKLSSEELFKQYLRKPDNAAMPAIVPEVVSDSDIPKLYAYLKSVH